MGKRKSTEDKFDDELQKIVDTPEDYKLPIEKETNMKISNTKKIVLSTIAVTVFVLVTLAATFYAGTRYEADRNAAITNEATRLVEKLKSENQ